MKATNNKLAPLAILAAVLLVLTCIAAIPDFTVFNTTQFSTNNLQISIASGVQTTNENLYGSPTVISTFGSYNGQPLVFSGIPDIVGTIADNVSTNLFSSLGETTFYTAPATPPLQLYRVTVYQNCEVGGAGNMHSYIAWSDNVQKRTNFVAADLNLNSATNYTQGTCIMVVSNSSVINYSFVTNGVETGSPRFGIHISLERLR